MRLLLVLLLPFTGWAGQLRYCYATWDDDPTSTITLHFHGIETLKSLTLYYDDQPHHSKISDYPFHHTVPLYKQLAQGRSIYHITLTHLKPDTSYYFTIAEQNHPLTCERFFHTLSPHPPYRLIEGGDWENTPTAQGLAQVAASYQVDGVLLGGDYPSGVSSKREIAQWDLWLDTYLKTLVGTGGRLIPFVMAIGNHEVVGGFGQTEKQAPFYFDFFRPGKPSYFSLPIGNDIQLFVLDSGHATQHGGEQREWLKGALERAQEKRLTLALYHVPLYPSVRFTEKTLLFRLVTKCLQVMGVDQPGRRLFSSPSLWGLREWLPLFDAYGLSLAFEHHDQALKRTHPLRGGKVDSSGTIYLGDGGFGPENQVAPIKGYSDSRFAKVKGKTPFFWLLELNETSLSCQAISLDYSVIDHLFFNY